MCDRQDGGRAKWLLSVIKECGKTYWTCSSATGIILNEIC